VKRTAPENVTRTVASYERGMAEYLANYSESPTIRAFRSKVARRLGRGARLLELGSGPGDDALYFESQGIAVTRSDATRAFVERMRDAGQEARLLDVTADDLPTGYDGVYANAVLLHLTRTQFADALEKAARSVTAPGLLALTMKEGDGDAWTSAKLARPRFFTYWREGALLAALRAAGWEPSYVEHVTAREPWINCICALAARADDA